MRMTAQHRVAVLEMGMNHPGEIAELAAIGQPTVALVNNAQREHQEFMHTVEAVARENGSVLLSLPADGVAVRSEEHTSELQSPCNLVCRLLLETNKPIFCCAHFLTATA